jgi:hypothetical protein
MGDLSTRLRLIAAKQHDWKTGTVEEVAEQREVAGAGQAGGIYGPNVGQTVVRYSTWLGLPDSHRHHGLHGEVLDAWKEPPGDVVKVPHSVAILRCCTNSSRYGSADESVHQRAPGESLPTIALLSDLGREVPAPSLPVLRCLPNLYT